MMYSEINPQFNAEWNQTFNRILWHGRMWCHQVRLQSPCLYTSMCAKANALALSDLERHWGPMGALLGSWNARLRSAVQSELRDAALVFARMHDRGEFIAAERVLLAAVHSLVRLAPAGAKG